MGDTIYLGDKVFTDTDTYLDADETVRVHKDGNNLQIQIKVGDEWVTQGTWGA